MSKITRGRGEWRDITFDLSVKQHFDPDGKYLSCTWVLILTNSFAEDLVLKFDNELSPCVFVSDRYDLIIIKDGKNYTYIDQKLEKVHPEIRFQGRGIISFWE